MKRMKKILILIIMIGLIGVGKSNIVKADDELPGPKGILPIDLTVEVDVQLLP
ncbi:hypothetical protein ACFSCX_10215 [Bacillus salitolerans]|uniref:Uncharacterized protein n=1 Tax=Bacillus salitolerans TaxID=1437434 RepID=A0ABW4LPD0_9BACI